MPIFSENIQKTSDSRAVKKRYTCLETVFLNKSCCGGGKVRTICCPPYWISIHECIIVTSRKLGIAVVLPDNQHEIAKMTDKLGQTILSRKTKKPKETATSEGMYPPLNKCPRI